jgi:uncharacterized membrane protein YwzB
MPKGRALSESINSRKMFVTIITIILLSIIYWKLDKSILELLIEKPKDVVAERRMLFSKYGEFLIIVAISYLGINQLGKGRYFQNNVNYNNNSEA